MYIFCLLCCCKVPYINMQGLPNLPFLHDDIIENQTVHMRLYKGRDTRMNEQRNQTTGYPVRPSFSLSSTIRPL